MGPGIFLFGPLPFSLQISHVDFVFPPPSPMLYRSVAFEVVLWEPPTSVHRSYYAPASGLFGRVLLGVF